MVSPSNQCHPKEQDDCDGEGHGKRHGDILFEVTRLLPLDNPASCIGEVGEGDEMLIELGGFHTRL